MPQMFLPFSRAARLSMRVVPLALAALGGACIDSPTYPGALHWLADDEAWVAVLPPDLLPTATAWARASRAPGDTALVRRVSDLESAAVATLWGGDVTGATVRRAEIVSALASVQVVDPALVRDASFAVDLWMGRVRDQVVVEEGTPLAAAVDTVSQLRDAAALALSEGDSIAGTVALIDAGERIRAWSPTVVAVRVLGRAEKRVAELPPGNPDGDRARHLIRSSTEAIRSGEPLLALQRALYALQVASGQRLDPAGVGSAVADPPT